MALSDMFLNTLYSAPTIPALWGDVLDACIAMVGAESGWVCELDCRDRFAGSGAVRNMEAATQDRYFAYYAALDPFRQNAIGAPNPGIGLWSDERFIAKNKLMQSEFYADFMTPIRVHSILIIRMFGDDHVTRSMHLNYGRRGDWQTSAGWRDLQEAFTHLKRAAALSREIGRLTSRSSAFVSALEASAECVFFLDRRGRICFATKAGETMLRRGDSLLSRPGRLHAAHPADTAEMDALVTLATGGAGYHRTGGLMHLTVTGRDTPAILAVAPLELVSAGEEQPAAMVTLRSPEVLVAASDQVLTKRFGLTPAERRIALMLAAGSSPRQISDSLAVSYNTVRNHLKKIYDKCAVRRQSDLVAALIRLGLIENDVGR